MGAIEPRRPLRPHGNAARRFVTAAARRFDAAETPARHYIGWARYRVCLAARAARGDRHVRVQEEAGNAERGGGASRPLEAPYPQGFAQALFGMGCFWGAERKFWELGEGIFVTAVGYAGGLTPNPTYEEVCSGRTGHNEVVLVIL